MAEPASFEEAEDVQGDKQSQLEICLDDPGPEEAAVVGSLEVGHQVTNEQELCPPVGATLVEKHARLEPNGSLAHVREQGPTQAKDDVERRR